MRFILTRHKDGKTDAMVFFTEGKQARTYCFFDKVGNQCDKIDDKKGAMLLANLLNRGYQFDETVPNDVINAFLSPAQYLPINIAYRRYNQMTITPDDSHFNDGETFYHITGCDCAAPLIEHSYFRTKGGAKIYRMRLHFPTSELVVNYEGEVMPKYRTGPTILPTPNTFEYDDYDDFDLTCVACGAQI